MPCPWGQAGQTSRRVTEACLGAWAWPRALQSGCPGGPLWWLRGPVPGWRRTVFLAVITHRMSHKRKFPAA